MTDHLEECSDREFELPRAFDTMGDEIGQLRCVDGAEVTVLYSGISSDDSATHERILALQYDKTWSAFRAGVPISIEDITSEVLKRLMAFGSPNSVYWEALKPR